MTDTAKKQLGKDIAGFYHGDQAPAEAEAEWTRRFSGNADPTDIPEVQIPASEVVDGKVPIRRLLVLLGLAKSGNEATRAVEGGGVTIGPNKEKVTDPKVLIVVDNGLIVPVVKGADELSLVGLAKRLNDLATRARGRQLKPDEIQGGTFTITNPGIFGTTIGFPIISQPQVAILGVGGVEMRPAVISDEYGNHAIVPRKRGYISLGYDHRLVNGADGDQFLARVKQLMETFPETA